MPKIRIAGAGIAGSYLWRLLTTRGMAPDDIEIVDPGCKTRCGISPCGFAITRQFYPLCREVGLDPQKYIVSIPGRSYQGNIRVRAKGYVLSIDKPAFIRDLLEGAHVISNPSNEAVERIIDATGNARAYIGTHSSDQLAPCIQSKVEFSKPAPIRQLPHHVGFAWVIPLEGNCAHVGIGSYTYDLETMKGIVKELTQGAKTICSCQGYVRVTGPILPLAKNNVWAIGEAGGLVDPLTGSGMVPAMVSAKLLTEHWDDAAGYEDAIMREYGWFRKTQEIVRTLLDTNEFKIWDLGLWKKYLEFSDLNPSISNLTNPGIVGTLMINTGLTLLQLPRVFQLLKSMKRN